MTFLLLLLLVIPEQCASCHNVANILDTVLCPTLTNIPSCKGKLMTLESLPVLDSEFMMT